MLQVKSPALEGNSKEQEQVCVCVCENAYSMCVLLGRCNAHVQLCLPEDVKTVAERL